MSPFNRRRSSPLQLSRLMKLNLKAYLSSLMKMRQKGNGTSQALPQCSTQVSAPPNTARILVTSPLLLFSPPQSLPPSLSSPLLFARLPLSLRSLLVPRSSQSAVLYCRRKAVLESPPRSLAPKRKEGFCAVLVGALPSDQIGKIGTRSHALRSYALIS